MTEYLGDEGGRGERRYSMCAS